MISLNDYVKLSKRRPSKSVRLYRGEDAHFVRSSLPGEVFKVTYMWTMPSILDFLIKSEDELLGVISSDDLVKVSNLELLSRIK